MQTILGSGGAIGLELAKALPDFTDRIRLVSRNPEKVNPTDELHPADLLQAEAVDAAVAGSDIVYLTVGLPYNTEIWTTKWPLIMDHTIAACKKHACRLVFFDNIYMYDPDHLAPMDENTPIRPVSKKGKVRASISSRLMDAVKAGELEALIARSADFYGPSVKNTSVLTETVFNNLAAGKPADWMGSLNFQHSFTYTPDAGKATALLGNSSDAFGQVWHLPTASQPPTGREWIDAIAGALGVPSKSRVAPKWLVRILGLFNPIMKEMVEMMYQYDRDYIFDSSKFESHFNFSPTPYAEGIRIIVETDYR
ncbi:NAD-dependent epimerase/dehydratase family protein [Flavilitoribacter nigricans]|uniref:NAD-dependent dehydratase n=1 Tax=Flavilitoribacter nigricans (strain ATCC 23147 / DSM 23189 / NBRC 102662 / NCIMB 1420 / SS-2) TaxID=1122177 RepID=A0A2D0N2N9_FLAN2|nr:NAD-dependent epimerase/dehydratase family protein [Flavilitoribacter nigricans]PHN02656.1 NAD-dependent dehydratase [Flavilitoribacter nigricans DSM 23189 = NBRC 102662]